MDYAARVAGHQHLSAGKVKNLSVVVKDRKRNVKLTVGDKDGIDEEKAANAVTANFVHSS